MLDELEERGRRWAAVETWGGITAVAAATGLSDRTIRYGLKELDDSDSLADFRQRRRGGGRKSQATIQAGLWDALDRPINPTARGSPTNPLR